MRDYKGCSGRAVTLLRGYGRLAAQPLTVLRGHNAASAHRADAMNGYRRPAAHPRDTMTDYRRLAARPPDTLNAYRRLAARRADKKTSLISIEKKGIMANKNLTTSYLTRLSMANHDGVSQQICDRLTAFATAAIYRNRPSEQSGGLSFAHNP